MTLEVGQKATAVKSAMHGFTEGQEIEFVKMDKVSGVLFYMFKGIDEEGEEYTQVLDESEFKLVKSAE